MTDLAHQPATRLTAIRSWLLTRDQERHLPWRPILEIGLIIIWAIWLGRDYLDFSPDIWPHGREFGMAIHPHYIWTQLKECGTCMLWNGYYNGGSPAFAELHAAVLHPLVIIPTLIWGGLNGAKITVIGSLAMAGIGQWWLAKVMKLGWLARLWSAGMAVAGGHLASRMEIGVVGIIVSTAACSLVIAPGIKLARSGKQRDVIPFAVTLALAIVAGQGYMQIGLLVSIIPAFAILFVDNDLRLRPVWKKFLLAGGLALMLAGPFIIPFLFFWSQFGKDIDPTFLSAQPLEYVPLNFIIRDRELYYTPRLGKLPYPYLYMNFIGWIPILLALLPLRLAKSAERRLLIFFWAAIGLVLLASSAITFKLLGQFLPNFAAGIRFPSLIAGLAVPLILGLAAWGVDQTIKLKWTTLIANATHLSYSQLVIRLSSFLLFMVLVISLRSTYQFSKEWLFTIDKISGLTEVVREVTRREVSWVALPFGEHYWGPDAAEANLKLTEHVRPSHWKERPMPDPHLRATRHNANEVGGEYLGTTNDINFIEYPQNQYAYVVDEQENVEPCTAVAQGGHIDVTCQTGQSGTLIVQENRWSGWIVRRDGVRTAIGGDTTWLNTPAPAGEHHYQFRYYPWDVVIGFSLSLAGLILSVLIWKKSPGSIN